MVLSLAPIIKESVTKPNVSLTQARRGEAQECFQHAGKGHIGETGEGLSRAPQTPGLGWRGFPGTDGEEAGVGARGGHLPASGDARLCQQWLSRAVFPPPGGLRCSCWPSATPGGTDEDILLKAQLTFPRTGGEAPPNTLTRLHTGTAQQSGVPRWRGAGTRETSAERAAGALGSGQSLSGSFR